MAQSINNDFYDALGERWYEAYDDPVALLRAEARHLTPWVLDRISASFGGESVRVLDLGCGAGFLSNALAKHGHAVTGLDASEPSLAVAARRDATKRVRYLLGDACSLPFGDAGFDVVTAMDFLEHVETPETVVLEASRVLAPGGLFFFHTFNRNFVAEMVVVKGVEWFVRNTPPKMHLLRLFLKPSELTALCRSHALSVCEIRGVRPELRLRPFWRLVATGIVDQDFAFRFTSSTLVAYAGVARKAAAHQPRAAVSA